SAAPAPGGGAAIRYQVIALVALVLCLGIVGCGSGQPASPRAVTAPTVNSGPTTDIEATVTARVQATLAAAPPTPPPPAPTPPPRGPRRRPPPPPAGQHPRRGAERGCSRPPLPWPDRCLTLSTWWTATPSKYGLPMARWRLSG